MEAAVRSILMYAIVPLWIAAGLGDWWFHRRTRIEQNAGAKESAFHLVMMVEVGLPVLLALFLEINAALLLVMAAAVVIHAATAWADVRYAYPLREIRPNEQHMHSFLEVLPVTALALIAVAHWDQVVALCGLDDAAPDFSLRRKEEPLPPTYVTALLAAVGLFVALPYAEEFLRCLRAGMAKRG